MRAWSEYRSFLQSCPETPTAWIDVIAKRPISLALAERIGIRHESPQAILLRIGEVVWHASHGRITRATLTEALAAQPGV